MEEAGSLSAQGRKPYTRARAKLADYSDAHHGEAGFFLLNAKEEAVHAHCGERELQRRPPWRGRVFFLNAKEEAVHAH
jgi:hypothetical protein